MKYFKLPDLGEGLQEAEIVEWHVSAGQTVSTDQILVSVETAKAIVDVPSPCTGTLRQTFGKVGDTLHTGQPLVEFEGEQDDTGTVVGKIESRDDGLLHETMIIGSARNTQNPMTKASPAVRLLARELGVALDTLQGSGSNGQITSDDVRRAMQATPALTAGIPLKGSRKQMAKTMALAHADVVKVTLCDDADVHAWQAGNDPTLRLIRAMTAACRAVPAVNSHFDGRQLALEIRESIDIGIAVDTPDGLFVPVLRDAGKKTPDQWRTELDQLRAGLADRSLPPAAFTGSSIALSNFGTLAGRYADPVVVPPAVAILGAGRIRAEPAVWQDSLVIRRRLPLSLSFDHRALTGGEAARFLRALIDDLGHPD